MSEKVTTEDLDELASSITNFPPVFTFPLRTSDPLHIASVPCAWHGVKGVPSTLCSYVDGVDRTVVAYAYAFPMKSTVVFREGESLHIHHWFRRDIVERTRLPGDNACSRVTQQT